MHPVVERSDTTGTRRSLHALTRAGFQNECETVTPRRQGAKDRLKSKSPLQLTARAR